ncbi:hypothetical protein GCM10022243_54360 [Saccharothrix violaceirubra]|uniref:SAM-dependent methyltransferase n=1 Tax=Saccharothrix violaceirubra TaxID=413306 RepID=A0A7W7WX19_9PSEU|nr:methyltransferase domain-containing protein [Saccharothrix violaceirubra]MBB4966950.1 SAM-dependent methyltransferase [Saccharothrix violaceirubra]
MSEFDKHFWAERYAHPGGHAHGPNAHLVAAASELPPGRALDAGSGHGADARWLAARGWRVTAVDIAAPAVVADGVEWITADLAEWVPDVDGYDLVTSHYVHPMTEELVARLAASVAPGGILLIVGHDPDDRHSAHSSRLTAGQISSTVDGDGWEVLVAEARTVDGPHGHALRDAVFSARKVVGGGWAVP